MNNDNQTTDHPDSVMKPEPLTNPAPPVKSDQSDFTRLKTWVSSQAKKAQSKALSTTSTDVNSYENGRRDAFESVYKAILKQVMDQPF